MRVMEGKDLDGRTPEKNKRRRVPCGAVFLILDGAGLAEDEEISVELCDQCAFVCMCVRACAEGKWAGDTETLEAKLSDHFFFPASCSVGGALKVC